MNRIEELKKAISEIEPLKPIFKIKLCYPTKNADLASSIGIYNSQSRDSLKRPYTSVDTLAQHNISESFNKSKLQYVIDFDTTFRNATAHVSQTILTISKRVSPAKRPHLTKLHKRVMSIYRCISYDSEVMNHFLGIYFYYTANLDEIETDSNCTHGKNILGLLTKISLSY